MYQVKIIRKTSKYNKYMKWSVEGESLETNARFVDYTKTLKEAIYKMSEKNSQGNQMYNVIEIIK